MEIMEQEREAVMRALDIEDIQYDLKRIIEELEEVEQFLDNEALAEAWTALEEIADKVIDLKDRVKDLWKEAGGM